LGIESLDQLPLLDSPSQAAEVFGALDQDRLEGSVKENVVASSLDVASVLDGAQMNMPLEIANANSASPLDGPTE
jgi:hypothetical protein